MSTGQTLRAGYVVGADGMHSAVREASGIGFTGSAYARVLRPRRRRDGLGPRPPTRCRSPSAPPASPSSPRSPAVTTGSSPPSTTRPPPPTSRFVQRLLDERAPARPTLTGLAWSSRFRVHHRVADHYRAGRLLLAGDAAHVHSPAGGQGMNTGIQDGYALGRAFATGQLDGYEAQRRPVAQRVVAFTDRMTRIATTRSPAVRGARNIVLPLLGRSALSHQARHRARRAQLPVTLRRHTPIATGDCSPGPVAAEPRTRSAVRADVRTPPGQASRHCTLKRTRNLNLALIAITRIDLEPANPTGRPTQSRRSKSSTRRRSRRIHHGPAPHVDLVRRSM